MEVWDAEIRDRYWDMGFHEGLDRQFAFGYT